MRRDAVRTDGLWTRQLGAVLRERRVRKERIRIEGVVGDDNVAATEERRRRVRMRKRRRFAVKQDSCSKMELAMLIGKVWRAGGCEFPLSTSESG